MRYESYIRKMSKQLIHFVGLIPTKHSHYNYILSDDFYLHIFYPLLLLNIGAKAPILYFLYFFNCSLTNK